MMRFKFTNEWKKILKNWIKLNIRIRYTIHWHYIDCNSLIQYSEINFNRSFEKKKI